VKSISHSILNDITNQYIAADSTNAMNNTINVISFDFICGLVHIAQIAPLTNIHSHTHAHNQANQIANHAQILAAILNHSVQNILNATINP